MSSTGILRGKVKRGQPRKQGAKKEAGKAGVVSINPSAPRESKAVVVEPVRHQSGLEGPALRDTVIQARAGDHHAVHRLLVSLLHQPSPAEFQAQLEDPFYQPSNRLVIKRSDHVVAHAHLVERQIHFGRQTIPIIAVNDFAVVPELKNAGLGAVLLEAIQRQVVDDCAQFGVLRTTQPAFFQQRGWSICLRHSYSTASALEILSHLRESQPATRCLLGARESELTVRIWRHVEQAALVRLYSEHAQGTFGPSVRTDAYWQWLISRRGYDRIYVAIDGPDKMDLNDSLCPIVGYAVMREGRILELVTAPNCPAAGKALLARACRDAIEQDRHYVQLDAAPHDGMHAVFTAASGEQRYYEAENGEVSMVWFADPIGFLRSLSKELSRRSKTVGLDLPSELGLQLDGDKYGLTVGSRHTKLTRGRVGRSYLECDAAALAQLLLGHMDVRSAVANGRLQASTRVAIETASALFPRLPIWRPPWDEAPAA